MAGAGTYTIKVHVGDDTVNAKYTIKKKSIKKMFKLNATKFLYTGKVLKPEFAMKSSGTSLVAKIANPDITIEGQSAKITDFAKVTYSNKKSKKVGSYTVTIKGKGNYTGTKTFKYSIVTKEDIKKACHKDTGKPLTKKQFEKRVAEFCSYNCYAIGAKWDRSTKVMTIGACQGYLGDMMRFIGSSTRKSVSSQSKIKEGDIIHYGSHVGICVGRANGTITILSGNDGGYVLFDFYDVGSIPDFHEAWRTIK